MNKQTLAKIMITCTALSSACAEIDDYSTPGEFDAESIEPWSGERPAELEVASFAAERGISREEAARRLHWQSRLPEFGEDAAGRLGVAFGGVWVDVHDEDRVKLGVVTTDRAAPDLADRVPHADAVLAELDPDIPLMDEIVAAERPESGPRLLETAYAAVDDAGLADAVDVIEVRHSWLELQLANAWIADNIERLAADGLSAGIRTDLNAVELQVPSGSTPSAEARAFLDEAKARLGEAVVLSTYAGRVEPRACVYPYCDPSLRGGNRILNSGAGCTNAFVAKSKVDAKMYQFTAGHCVDGPYSDTWSTKFTDGSTHDIGPRHNSIFGNGGDMAILRINNVNGWDPENWVHVTSGPDTSTNIAYTITSEAHSYIGMRICTTGGFYGHSDCGYVTQLGVTASYGGQTVNNLGRASFCGTQGDSGAPMYASHRAYGLQVAGYSECDSLYQGISGAESKMNVNIIH